MMDLLKLAERVEGECAPSTWLFTEVYAACNGGVLFAQPATPEFVETHRKWEQFRRMIDAEAWLDAAMTLVPDTEYDLTNLYGVARAHIELANEFGGHHGSNECGSMPLALAAAALRALATTKEQS